MSLREKLKAHYGNKRFPAERLAGFAALADRPPRRDWGLPALAAAVLAALALLWIFRSDTPPTTRDVALEIAANHRHAYAPEFATQDYDELRGRMERLDFALLEPRRNLDGLALRGARYCSVHGRIAAQVRLEDAAGRACTLYEVRAAGLLDLAGEVVVQLDDLEIRLWREGGLLLGLARPRD